jgi:hypothetical protein
VEVYPHAFLTSALDGGEWSTSCPGRFTPRERAPGTYCVGSWVDPRAGLDGVVNCNYHNDEMCLSKICQYVPSVNLKPVQKENNTSDRGVFVMVFITSLIPG